MAKLTPVYYLESGTVKFWQQEGVTSSATVITPNAIVAKKQSNAQISYNPYEKYTLVTFYKGEAEVGDLATGKKMFLSPSSDGKPRIAIISFAPTPSPTNPAASSVPVQPGSSGFNTGILIAVGFLALIPGYIIIRKRLYLAALYSRLKQWSLAKVRKMRKNSQKGIAHIILILLVLLAALAVWFFAVKPFQTKVPQKPVKTNPFEVRVNPFKDIKTNPFR